jgi:ceramide glucosyltransferase
VNSLIAAWVICAAAALFHVASSAIAARRCSSRPSRRWAPAGAPPVSLVRTLCGAENFIEETLESTFRLDYPDYAIVFCLARVDDPVAPIARRLIAAHRNIPARLLIGEDRTSLNPKLNNAVKGWEAAKNEWIILADSNVLLPVDYIQRLQAAWRDDTGVVSAMPIGSRPGNFWAELECAFLNTYEARWEFTSDALGCAFAHGKNLLFRRDIIERAGGIRALGAELAEDAAATKIVRLAGLRVRLIGNPFPQPLGRRSAGEVWRRQLRWARLWRRTFPLHSAIAFAPGLVLPLLAGVYATSATPVVALAFGLLLTAAWYGAEAALVWKAGWHWSWRMPLAFALRDAMVPVLWAGAWFGVRLAWRGTEMRAGLGSRANAKGLVA